MSETDAMVKLAAEVALWKSRALAAQQSKRAVRLKLKKLRATHELHVPDLDDYDGLRYDYAPLKGQTVRELARRRRYADRDKISKLEDAIKSLIGDRGLRESLRKTLEALDAASEAG